MVVSSSVWVVILYRTAYTKKNKKLYELVWENGLNFIKIYLGI